MPIALVGLAIKLALVNGTPVFAFVRVALRFPGVPLAVWIICANRLIDFGGAWNVDLVVFVTAFLFVIVAFPSDTEVGAGDQDDSGDKGGEVLHRRIIPPEHSTSQERRSADSRRVTGTARGSRLVGERLKVEEFAAEGYTHVECYCPRRGCGQLPGSPAFRCQVWALVFDRIRDCCGSPFGV
jgi:hypothetical protein